MTAISIHIGLNQVDPAHYQGWSGQLRGCENDARDMKAIADSRGYASSLMLTREATSDRVLQALAEAARGLKGGDSLLLTYSGHGSRVPDTNGDEPSGMDDTWVLYDRMLVDDELYAMWSQFAPGVRILMLSDSCHSGTMARVVPIVMGDGRFGSGSRDVALVEAATMPRLMPFEISARTYKAARSMYDAIQWTCFRGHDVEVGASVILFSGCQDDQTSGDGLRNGVFTEQVLRVWDQGRFSGGHRAFFDRVQAVTSPFGQTPNYFKVGADDAAFEAQTPFTPSGAQPRSSPQGATMSNCNFSLDVTGLPDNAGENDIRRFLLTDGCDVLMQAFAKTRQLKSDVVSATRSLPRDGTASVGCTADSHGGVSCGGSVTWHF